MDRPQPRLIKNTILSAAILAIANMGDAFLYAYLPANYQDIGLSAFWVGVILSVNRVTRLLLNGSVAWLFSRMNVKYVLAGSAILSSAITLSYGFLTAVPVWILTRILWGVCFSALRLGSTLYALDDTKKGFSLGVSRSVAELGPVLALVVAPWLLIQTGDTFTFMVFGLLSMLALCLVLPLHDLSIRTISRKELMLSMPSSFNGLVLIHAFIADGILVVVLTRLIVDDAAAGFGNELAWAGLLLGYKRMAVVMLSPFSGWLADKLGFQKVFLYSLMGSAAALLLILSGATVPGIGLFYTFSAMNASAATGGAVNTDRSFIKDVSDNATWRDLGAAMGAFSGALLLAVDNMNGLLAALLVLYAAGFWHYRYRNALNSA